MKKTCLFLVGVAALALSQSASAGLVVVGDINQPGFGFGNVNRDLTLHETGAGDDVESGCVGITGAGAFQVGSGACISDAQVFQGNGFSNAGGDEPPPQADNHRYGAPTISELGFTNAGEILIGFDAAEPGAAAMNGLTVEDLTLKFYDGGELVLAIDGSAEFLQTITGVGRADYFFGIDEEQQEEVNNLIFNAANFGDYRMALEATISNAQGGPESFFLVHRDAPQVPEPASLGLLGLGIAGLGLARRRKN